MQLCAALICLACVDRSGRKLFLLLSTAISAVSLLVLGAFILLEDLRWLSLEQYGPFLHLLVSKRALSFHPSAVDSRMWMWVSLSGSTRMRLDVDGWIECNR